MTLFLLKYRILSALNKALKWVAYKFYEPIVTEGFVTTTTNMNYVVYKSSHPGYYGSIISLENILAGDTVEISVLVGVPDTEGKLRFVKDKVVQLSGYQGEPVLRVEEFYSRHGITLVLNQISGVPKTFYYQVIRSI